LGPGWKPKKGRKGFLYSQLCLGFGGFPGKKGFWIKKEDLGGKALKREGI